MLLQDNYITITDVQAAAKRLDGIAHRTLVLTSRTVNQHINSQVFFKCENFQRTGSFKFRGAYNALSQLSETQKQKGVLTFSSGNHAQGIALAGQLLNIPTTINHDYFCECFHRFTTKVRRCFPQYPKSIDGCC